MFKNVTNLALLKLREKEVLQQVLTHDDLVIYFDALCADFAKLHYDISCEEFKATISKYDILNDSDVQSLTSTIVETIASLAPNFQSQQTQ